MNNKKGKIFIVGIIIAILSGVTYKLVIVPKMYNKYLNTGIKCLINDEYKEAMLAFDKALKIERKSTEVRIYQAKAYLENGQVNKAVEVLKEAYNIDSKNEKLIKQIIEILNDVDSEVLYKILISYINSVGIDNVSDEIKTMYKLANEIPNEPNVNIAPGKYARPISIKLELNEKKLGHVYYYTLNGTHPNKGSDKYDGKIEVNKTSTIKIIGYNQKDESTNVITLEYVVDESIMEEIENNIIKAETLINKTEVGDQVGNISQAEKDKLQVAIDETKRIQGQTLIHYETARDINNKVLNSIKSFEDNIIKQTDKSNLKNMIDEAEKLYQNSTEGSNNGEYKSGSKATLLSEINAAKNIYDSTTSKQSDIDKKVSSLKNAINIFNQAKISSDLESKILGKYIYYREDRAIKNKLISAWIESESCDAQILSKREEGNIIYYKVRIAPMYEEDSYEEIEIKIEIINENTIYLDGYTQELLTTQQLIDKVYKDIGEYAASYEYLKYWGITQQDINTFYSNK